MLLSSILRLDDGNTLRDGIIGAARRGRNAVRQAMIRRQQSTQITETNLEV